MTSEAQGSTKPARHRNWEPHPLLQWDGSFWEAVRSQRQLSSGQQIQQLVAHYGKTNRLENPSHHEGNNHYTLPSSLSRNQGIFPSDPSWPFSGLQSNRPFSGLQPNSWEQKWLHDIHAFCGLQKKQQIKHMAKKYTNEYNGLGTSYIMVDTMI